MNKMYKILILALLLVLNTMLILNSYAVQPFEDEEGCSEGPDKFLGTKFFGDEPGQGLAWCCLCPEGSLTRICDKSSSLIDLCLEEYVVSETEIYDFLYSTAGECRWRQSKPAMCVYELNHSYPASPCDKYYEKCGTTK